MSSRQAVDAPATRLVGGRRRAAAVRLGLTVDQLATRIPGLGRFSTYPLRTSLLRARVDISARAFTLLVGFALTTITSSISASSGTLFLLIGVVATMGCWAVISPPTNGNTYVFGLVAESVFAMTVVSLSATSHNAYIVYLVVPPLLAGLRAGLLPSTTIVFVEALAFLALNAQSPAGNHDLLALYGPWIATGFTFAILGSWIHQLSRPRLETELSPYASAHHLLSELRTITRDLPSGLDTETVSETVLLDTTNALDGQRSALLLTHDSAEPFVIAHQGDDSFATYLIGNPVVRRAMQLQRIRQLPLEDSLSAFRFRTVLPLVIGNRCIGCVVVDGPGIPPPDVVAQTRANLDEAALQLESSVLFGDVRAVATVEERRRLAREIHDGIAQEIASLGYLVDDLSRERCSDPDHRHGLADLRSQLTRIITELRMSIFDLRLGVSTNAGLGSVLGTYVRETGKSSGMAVHVSLEESQRRLRLDVETELLRIAQEAITNARKHSHASNLWITCRVEPPFAELRIEDDGTGSSADKDGHYGLQMMQERARRINAVLTIGDRVGGGTTVSVVLLPNDLPSSISQKTGGNHGFQRLAR